MVIVVLIGDQNASKQGGAKTMMGGSGVIF